MTKEYFQIPHTDIDKHWDLFAVLIQKAIDKVDNNDYSIFGTYHRLKTNQWQLFCVLEDNELNCIFVTCVTPFDLNCYLHVCITTGIEGKKVDYQYMLDCYKEIARNFNCNKISAMGRKGWKRIMPKYGCDEQTLFTITME